MTKKIVLVVLTAMMAILFLIWGRGFEKGIHEIYEVDITTYEMVRSSKRAFPFSGLQGNGKEYLVMTYDGEPVPYDSGSNTYFLPADFNEQKLKMRTKIGCKISSPDVWEEFKSDKNNIASGTAYRILVHNWIFDREYNFVLSGLPLIQISLNKELESRESVIQRADVEYAEQAHDWPVGDEDDFAYMRVFGMDTDDGVVLADAKIHARGGTSRWYPKNGYRLKLMEIGQGETDAAYVGKKNIPLLGMRDSSEWILNALYSEETKIRDKLSADLWNAFGAENNPYGIFNGTRMEYCELFINDTYWGIYLLSEIIDEKQLDLSEGDVLYKMSSSEISDSEEFMNAEGLLEYKEAEVKYPKTAETGLWQPLAEYIKWIFETTDTEFAECAEEFVFTEQVMDYWIFNQMLSAADNTWKNLYFSVKDMEKSNKVLISPWDFDMSWGIRYNSGHPLNRLRTKEAAYDIVSFEAGNRMLELNVDNCREVLKRRWKELRSSILAEEELQKKIDELAEEVQASGAFQRECIRWKDEENTSDVSYLKDYVKERLEFLDGYIENLR